RARRVPHHVAPAAQRLLEPSGDAISSRLADPDRDFAAMRGAGRWRADRPDAAGHCGRTIMRSDAGAWVTGELGPATQPPGNPATFFSMTTPATVPTGDA